MEISTDVQQTPHALKRNEQEKTPDSSENGTQKPRPNKAKKRKKPKDSTAPRHPLTGIFVRLFCFNFVLFFWSYL